jgi:hypothetical protein
MYHPLNVFISPESHMAERNLETPGLALIRPFPAEYEKPFLAKECNYFIALGVGSRPLK